MMDVVKRRSRQIQKVYREKNALYLIQETGLIRIIPETDWILRVSYTENGEFQKEQGEEFKDLSDGCAWDYDEQEQAVILSTEKIRAVISKVTGAIRYEKKDNTLYVSEQQNESKLVEAFDQYKVVVNENTQVENVETADGAKKKIVSSDRVFDRKVYHTKLSFQFAEDEKLFGLGQAEEGVWNLRHTTQYLHQANLKIAIPILVSNRGYGILLSTQSPAIFEDTQYGSAIYTEADEYLDYYFLGGNCLDDVVRDFREITGKAVMLPKWAFGYVQSKERYESAMDLEETAKKFRKTEFGMDALVLDWISWEDNMWGQKTFDKKRFPDAHAMVEKLHEMDVHFMISIWPNMCEASANNHEMKEKGQLLPASDIYNALSEEGRALYWKQVKEELYSAGTDGWWCDSSEPVTPEWGRHMRPHPAQMYQEYVEAAGKILPLTQANAYGYYHAKSVYEGQRSETEEKRVINLTRSGYPGSQKYGTMLWSGDTFASWENLRKQVIAGLQFCASGMPYWTLDIGAFFVKKGEPWYWNGNYPEGMDDLAYQELYVRWYQYGAFLPMFRSHGTDCCREPWNFGEPGNQFYDALLAANQQRYRLMPYIYSLAADMWKNDGTMLRLLAFDFMEDERACEVSDQYMFGPSLMVCPILQPMYYDEGNQPLENTQKGRKVYLPKGTDWYDIRNHRKYPGGQEIFAEAILDSIPVFAKAGALIPTTKPANSVEQQESQPIVIEVYPGADGVFELYEDSGDGYGYEKGDYCLTTIRYSQADHKITYESEGNMEYRKGAIQIKYIS